MMKEKLLEIGRKSSISKDGGISVINAFLSLRKELTQNEQQSWDEVIVKWFVESEPEMKFYAHYCLTEVSSKYIVKSLTAKMKELDQGSHKRDLIAAIMIEAGAVNDFLLSEIEQSVDWPTRLGHLAVIDLVIAHPTYIVFCCDQFCKSLNKGNVVLFDEWRIGDYKFCDPEYISLLIPLVSGIIERKPRDCKKFALMLLKTVESRYKSAVPRPENITALCEALRM